MAEPEARITRLKANTADVQELFAKTSDRFKARSQRIITCQGLRRGTAKIAIPSDWGNAQMRDWTPVVLRERQTMDLDLKNALGREPPDLERIPIGTTQTAAADADLLESFCQSIVETDVPTNVLRGKAVEDGELLVLVVPDEAAMNESPEYMEDTEEKDDDGEYKRKPRAVYDRDHRGNPTEAKGYHGRDEAASRKAYDDEWVSWMASNHPWTVRVVEALDYAPIMTRGKYRPWECSGVVIRTLYDRETLIERGYAWKDMDRDELIPRSWRSKSPYGKGGSIYLYEAYLMLESEDEGDPHPCIVYCVGGEHTTFADKKKKKKDQAAIIDLYEEYGLHDKMWEVFEGLHFEDDPEYRGLPYIWPVAQAIKNAESLLTANLSATQDDAYEGRYAEPDPNIPKEAYIENGRLMKFDKSKQGEVKVLPGRMVAVPRMQIGEDAYKMAASLLGTIKEHAVAESQVGGAAAAGGYGQNVANELFAVAKDQIRQSVLDATEFIISRVLMICMAMKAREDLDAAVFVTEEQPASAMKESKASQKPLVLNERWLGGRKVTRGGKACWIGANYRLQGSYRKDGNLAEVEQAASLVQRGLGTDLDVYKAQGIKSPDSKRLEVAGYRFMQQPAFLLELQAAWAKRRGYADQAEQLELAKRQALQPDGTPTAALDDRYSGPMNLQDQAQSSRAGIISGQTEAAGQAREAQITAGGNGMAV